VKVILLTLAVTLILPLNRFDIQPAADHPELRRGYVIHRSTGDVKGDYSY
jgi:hypothetical protein